MNSEFVQHDWHRDYFSSDRRTCNRCGCVEIEHEFNTESESTRVTVTYHRYGAMYDHDPGCCERG